MGKLLGKLGKSRLANNLNQRARAAANSGSLPVTPDIDVENMKAINLPHYKLKLRDVSRELYLENGWQLPRGLVNSKERDPANFTHAQREQAKRAVHDPRALKGMFQECWAASDSRQAFASAIQARLYARPRRPARLCCRGLSAKADTSVM